MNRKLCEKIFENILVFPKKEKKTCVQITAFCWKVLESLGQDQLICIKLTLLYPMIYIRAETIDGKREFYAN